MACRRRGNQHTHNELDGQVALVTGATGGLGRAIALQPARDGAEIVVQGRNAERGRQTVDAITSEGGTARFVAADVSDPAAPRRAMPGANAVDDAAGMAGSVGLPGGAACGATKAALGALTRRRRPDRHLAGSSSSELAS